MATDRRPTAFAFAFASLLLLVGSGCSLPVTDECLTYMDCQAHYDELEGQEATNVNMYKAEGVCWENEDLAQECTATCVERTYELYDLLDAGGDDTGPCLPNPGSI